MTDSPTCGICTRPVPDQAYVCGDCTRPLTKALTAVPDVLADLRVTLTRLDRIAPGIGPAFTTKVIAEPDGAGWDPINRKPVPPPASAHHGPLPFSVPASDARAEITRTIRALASEVCHHRGLPRPFGDAGHVAVWLADGQVEWLRHHEQAAQHITAITHAVNQARRVIDRPADRWYAGPCGNDDAAWAVAAAVFGGAVPCIGELYALPGEDRVVCPICEWSYDVADRRAWLLEASVDVLATASLIAKALTSLSSPVTAERIWQWRSRGQLLERARDQQDRPLYRVGDVRELVAAAMVRDAERSARRGARGA